MASGTKLSGLELHRGDTYGRNKWQRMTSLIAAADANTALTATQVCQHWRHITDAAKAFDVIYTKIVSGLRISFWGAGSDTNAITANLYGWNDDGPGNHIGTVTAALIAGVSTKISGTTSIGFHTDTDLHSSLKGPLPTAPLFDTAVDYHPCDTYAVTDYEGALAASATHADFPGYVELSLANSQYSWVACLFTSIASTNIAAICRALGLKSNLVSPDGT